MACQLRQHQHQQQRRRRRLQCHQHQGMMLMAIIAILSLSSPPPFLFNEVRAEAASSSSASSPPPLPKMPPPVGEGSATPMGPGSGESNIDSSSAVIPNAGGPFAAADSLLNKDEDKGDGVEGGTESTTPEIITDAASALAHANNNPNRGNSASFNIDPFGGLSATIPPAVNTGGNTGGESGGGGGWFGKILGGNKNANEQKVASGAAMSQGSGGRGDLPPPPPPPPPPMNKDDAMIGSAGSHQQNKQRQQQQQLASTSWNPQQQQQQQQQQQPMNPSYNTYNQQQQNYMNANNEAYYQNLLYELDESTLREMTLTHQIHNLTSLLTTSQSESDMLLSRIDVLTERLADSDANFHYVHNRNLELDANCTSLMKVVEGLRKEIEGYEMQQKEMVAGKEESDRLVNELRAELRKVTSELEKLACLVETERFEDEKTKYLDDFHEKQVHKRKKKKKKQSFWAWLFGWDTHDSSTSETSMKMVTKEQQSLEEEERRRAAQELARTTLLHALQTERANVDELENAVMTLQRNNSAIMDVVSSRDSLIAELNDRVAVFEEDKMVLKAALRQLQMEIKEEAPKTQLLVEELKEAKEREAGLRDDIAQLLVDFEEERLGYEGRLNEMNKTCEELELIGLYVDQLEDRLANYALAKKELDLSQAECERLRQESNKNAEEAKEYKAQVEILEKERDEKTKPLLEDLITERSQSRSQLTQMTNKVKSLEDQISQWKERLAEAEKRGEEIKSESARQLFLKVEEEKVGWVQRLEEEKRQWESAKKQELESALQKMKAEWERCAEQERMMLDHEAETNLQSQLHSQLSELQSKLNNEFQSKLTKEQSELKEQYDLELKNKMEQELATLEERKEREMEERLAEERTSWEELRRKLEEEHEEALAATKEAAEAAAAQVSAAVSVAIGTGSLEDEVTRAAERVYARMEENGVSFGMGSGDVDIPLPALFSSAAAIAAADDEGSLGEEGSKADGDMSEESSTDKDAHDDNDVVEEGADKAGFEVTGVEDETREKESGESSSSSSHELPMLPNQKPPPPPLQHHPMQQQKQQQRNKAKPTVRPVRKVPFRSVRKAFSRATGMHGLITPSTVQLHQRQRELLRKKHQEKQKRDGKNKPTTSTKKEQPGDNKDSTGDDESSSISTIVDDSSTSSTTSESSLSLQGANDEDGSTFSLPDNGGAMQYQQPTDTSSFSEQSTSMNGSDSWGSHFQGDADGFVASSSWSSGSAERNQDFLEPPPLPEMDDR